MEEVLKKFAGEAYHFRYYLEEPPNPTRPKTEKNPLNFPSFLPIPGPDD
jgi:hypothetical protein